MTPRQRNYLLKLSLSLSVVVVLVIAWEVWPEARRWLPWLALLMSAPLLVAEISALRLALQARKVEGFSDLAAKHPWLKWTFIGYAFFALGFLLASTNRMISVAEMSFWQFALLFVPLFLPPFVVTSIAKYRKLGRNPEG